MGYIYIIYKIGLNVMPKDMLDSHSCPSMSITYRVYQSSIPFMPSSVDSRRRNYRVTVCFTNPTPIINPSAKPVITCSNQENNVVGL